MNPLFGQTRENVRFAEAISKILKAEKSGKKIGLFIGRQAHEALPQEEAWEWVSLDREQGRGLDPNRIHIECDFNDEKYVQRIKHLFDKVVVDLEVTKYFTDETLHYDPVERLGALLKTSHLSALVLPCETLTQFFEGKDLKPVNFNRVSHLESESQKYKNKCQELLNNYKISTDSESREKELRLFKKNSQNYYEGVELSEEELWDEFYDSKMQELADQQGLKEPASDDAQIVRDNMQNLLEKVFKQIEFHKWREYPYETKKGSTGTDYFIAHDPKQ